MLEEKLFTNSHLELMWKIILKGVQDTKLCVYKLLSEICIELNEE
jgi:hypothetical protein